MEKYISVLFLTEKDNKLLWLQFRINHNILPTKKFLFKIGISSNKYCTFCKTNLETLEHVFSSPGRRAYAMMQRPSVRRLSVWHQLFPLNDFSRSTRPISTKLGRKHAWEMGIQICSNKWAGSFWGPITEK